ncbi:nitroreductase family protein [Streptomyces sp. N50]|uniref:nitroreductase family protein n=1 Tax=Streptomyces sp. N50 TaxID=3081765 RepID=UPI0029623EDC|nr:nitroreductase family protein [Streptomyces sp. N50]WOX12934.1 nitroreductase family protein [Streptomyces sp. N50]
MPDDSSSTRRTATAATVMPAVRHRLDLTRPVPRQLLKECVDLAVQASTGRNRQRGHFVIVADPERRAALAEVWRAGVSTPGVSDPELHARCPREASRGLF